MPFTELSGVRTYYEDYGEGPVVVLLHHGFGSSEMWRGVLPNLVGAGYRVLMYDRRGYGQSGEGPEFDKFFVSDEFRSYMVEHLAAFCAEQDLKQIHLVGQCEGGVLALDYAARYGNQVKSLTVASTMCHSLTDLVTFNAEKFPLAFDDLSQKVRDKMIKWHGPDNAGRRWEMYRTRGGAYGSGMFDLRPLLPSVTSPVLILYPDRSALFEVEQAVALYRGLPNAELAIIPGCGHNSYEHKPQEYLRLVANFLHQQEHGADGGLLAMATCAG